MSLIGRFIFSLAGSVTVNLFYYVFVYLRGESKRKIEKSKRELEEIREEIEANRFYYKNELEKQRIKAKQLL